LPGRVRNAPISFRPEMVPLSRKRRLPIIVAENVPLLDV
jgi:hypothetical protein